MAMQDLDPLSEFVESLGLSAEADGLPRIAGRILGLLIVEEGPFHFDDLAERLQVSRGSISTNTRLLEERGLLERFTVPGDRRDLFRLRDDTYTRLLERSLERLEHMHAIIDRCRDRIDESQEPAWARLGAMKRFYSMAIENTKEIIHRWQASQEGAVQESTATTENAATAAH